MTHVHPRRAQMRSAALSLAIATAVLVAAPTQGTPTDATTHPSRVVNDDTAAIDDAVQAAKATGTPVEVETLTTETNLVTAQPDGTFELAAHREPVRTDLHGDWEPIDTTLQVAGDGTIKPAAITIPIAFSDGGNGVIATAGEGDESIEFTWDEGPLPAPVIEGHQVTYPEVRPGIDLVFSAHASGFSDALVVKTPAAADALDRNPVEFTGTSAALDLKTTADGTLVASNSTGEPTLVMPPPVAWDSSGGGRGSDEPSAETSGTGAVHDLPVPRVTESDATPESSVTIEVGLPAELDQPDTVYPIFLDPQIDGRSSTRYRTVHSAGWNYSADNQFMRVGYCGWYPECNDSTQGNARSYFEFDITVLSGLNGDPYIYWSKVEAYQVWNASSSPQKVNLRRSGHFSSTESYPGPAGTVIEQAESNAGYGADDGGWLAFDHSNVANYVEERAAAENDTISFALVAPQDNNKYLWKKFHNNTKLTVHYSYYPKITSYRENGGIVACPTEAVHSRGSLNVRVLTDPVYGNPAMKYHAQVFKTDATNDGPFDSTTLEQTTGWQTGPESGLPWISVPSFKDLPYGRHAWRTNVQSQVGVNHPSGGPYPGTTTSTDPAARPFIVDDRAPADPIITSDDYPENFWGRSSPRPGKLAVTISDGTAGIGYAFNGYPESLTDDLCREDKKPGFVFRTDASNDVMQLTPPANLQPGVPHRLTVYAFDKAHNVSKRVTYQFYVSPEHDGTTDTNRRELEGTEVAVPSPIPNMAVSGRLTTVGGPGQYLTLTTEDSEAKAELGFTVAADGYYAFGTKFNRCATCGKAKVKISGVQNSEEIIFDTAATASAPNYAPLGGYQLKKGVPYQMTVSLPDALSGSPQTVQLDYLTVAQLHGGTYGGRNTNPEDNFTLHGNLAKAFNNQGIGTEGATGKAFEPALNATDVPDALWRDKLDQAGITGTFETTFNVLRPTPENDNNIETVTTKFVMPTPNNGSEDSDGGGDNVIAGGQRIVMPDAVATEAVDFLVAATCKPVLKKASVAFDLVHGDPGGTVTVTTNAGLWAAVPRWQDSPQETPTNLTAIPINGHLSGSPAQANSGAVHLYVLEVRVDRNHVNTPLLEVRLPHTGTSRVSGCDVAPRLHILAMARRSPAAVPENAS